jgi:hypothetical protein
MSSVGLLIINQKLKMDSETANPVDQWFDSIFLVLNESYQLDLCQLISIDIYAINTLIR